VTPLAERGGEGGMLLHRHKLVADVAAIVLQQKNVCNPVMWSLGETRRAAQASPQMSSSRTSPRALALKQMGLIDRNTV
jgi:hypothetical protein